MTSRATLEREVWQALRSIVLDHNDRRREVCDALDMSFLRVKALRRVAAGPIAMRDLASALMTDSPYTTLVVDDLEARGLVARTAHPDDRRAKVVTATADGRREARRAERILATAPRQVRALGDDDLTVLHRITSALLD